MDEGYNDCMSPSSLSFSIFLSLSFPLFESSTNFSGDRLFSFSDKKRTEGMTGRSSAKRRTALCLLALLLLFFRLSASSVVGEPIPESEFYGKTSDNDFVSIHRFIISLIARSRYSPHSNLCTCFNRQILLNKLKELFEEKQYVAEREKELDKERMKIQSIIMEGKESEIQSDSDYYAEKLPTPNAVVRQEPQHSGKRTMISCE